MKTLFFSLAALPILAACATVDVAPPAQKAFVIRHLEKDAGNDPPLTATGRRHAEALAARLRDEGIAAVFATDTRRAQETGRPVAEAASIPVTPYAPTDVEGLAARIAAANGSTLVVGHSNTVPLIVTRLSGKAQPPIDESRYGDLYIVDLQKKTVVVERIGD